MTAVQSPSALQRWLVGISAMVLAFLLAPAGAARAASGGDGIPVPPEDLSAKGTGEISAADRDFVVKVRLAGLWEVPGSNMAETKSENPRVVEIAKSISAQHV